MKIRWFVRLASVALVFAGVAVGCSQKAEVKVKTQGYDQNDPNVKMFMESQKSVPPPPPMPQGQPAK